MNHTNNLKSPTFPVFVDPRTTWTGRTFVDEGPFFRQLPSHAVETSPPATAPESSERRATDRRDLQLGIEIYGYDDGLSLPSMRPA